MNSHFIKRFLYLSPVIIMAGCTLIWSAFLLRYEIIALKIFEYNRYLADKNSFEKPITIDSPNISKELNEFVNIPGVGAWAQGSIITLQKIEKADSKVLEQSTRKYLMRQPTSGRAWNELAVLELYNQKPLADALLALSMARMTSPREIIDIEERLGFSIVIWSMLPESERESVASEFAASQKYFDQQTINKFKVLVTNLSDADKSSLMDYLQRKHVDPLKAGIF